MRQTGIALSLAVCLALAGCLSLPGGDGKGAEEKFLLQKADYAALPGWTADNAAQAVVPLQKSCVKIMQKAADDDVGPVSYAGKVADWQPVCEKLALYLFATPPEARVFFEKNFTPYAVWGSAGRKGLFTGYYEPVLHGAPERKPPYLIPLYARPDDLVTVNLGDFKPELKGETVMGRVTGEKLVPYFSRADIGNGALSAQKKEIIWVDNAVDAFFLHIQGSGQVRMEDGTVLRVGYAAQNGRPYLAIGKELIARGALTPETVSMQTIRAWLEAHPAEAPEVMNLNASYVFFKPLDSEGPLGAQGVALTPGRSLAVDRRKIAYGTPVWLDAAPPEGGPRLQRLMIAQDTGGAIRGTVRGDFFWGAGPEAAHKAGLMKSDGQMWLLLPNPIRVPDESRSTWWRRLFF